MKKLLLLILILFVAGGAYAFVKLDDIVKTGVEVSGPEVMNVPVTVDSVSLAPFSGKLRVKGLAVGQPGGFGDGNIASVGSFDVKLRTSTLLSDHIIIDSIVIDAPMLDVRTKGRNTNFDALQKGMAPMPAADAGAPAMTMTIKQLMIKGPKVAITTEDGPIDIDKTITLADFTLTDLGTDEKGLAPAEIARHVMDVLQPQIAKALIEAGASAKLKEMAGDARGTLEKGLGSLVGKLKKKTTENTNEKENDGNN